MTNQKSPNVTLTDFRHELYYDLELFKESEMNLIYYKIVDTRLVEIIPNILQS